MRLELDLNNPEALRKQREEFARAISVIDAALAGAPANGATNGAAALVNRDVGREIDEFGARMNRIPKHFTIRDVMEAFPDFSRGAAKNILADMCESGHARVAEQGHAGRATMYEKT